MSEKKNNTLVVILQVVKYAIAVAIGFLSGNGDIVDTLL